MTGPGSAYRVLVGGVEAVEPEPVTNWTFTWADRAAGVARLQAADREGLKLLRELKAQGAGFVGVSPYMGLLLAQK